MATSETILVSPNEPDIRDVVSFEQEYRARPEVRAAAERAARAIPTDPNGGRYIAIEVDPITGETGAAYNLGDQLPPGVEPPAGDGETGGTPTKPCPDCGATPGVQNSDKQTVNKKKKPVSDTNSWFPNQPFAGLNFLQIGALVLESIGNFFGNLTDKLEIKEGKCRTCSGSRQVEDKTNQQPEIQRTKAAVEANKERLIELESKASGGTGPGGNRTTLVVGDEYIQVGAAYNDSKSYEVLPETLPAKAGVQIDKKGVTQRSRMTATVNGLNPLPVLGGTYTIQCGNKFMLRAGAQGVEIATEGPVKIGGGQTRVVGPEVTIGTAAGQTIIEGDHLQLNGKSISITPDRAGDGQVSVQGTLTTSGNIIAQGGAHIEGDLSFISASCPFKEERTKHSSQETEYGGPARWSARAAAEGLKDYLRTLTIRTLDPSLIIVSPRQALNLFMDDKELAEKALTLELLPTGVILPGQCIVYGVGVATNAAPIPIYNFPHHHTLTDMMHAHNMRVPNINLLEDDEQVRGAAKPKELRAPVPINKESALLKLFKLIQAAYQATVATIQRLGS